MKIKNKRKFVIEIMGNKNLKDLCSSNIKLLIFVQKNEKKNCKKISKNCKY